MKIAFFEVDKQEVERFRESFNNHELLFFEDKIQDVDFKLYENSDILCVFIQSRVDSNIINSMPNIKYITTKSTGYDHIDINLCREKNISVSNIPVYGENTVAEHTFALILSLSRNIHKSYVRTMSNNFSTDGIQGFDLKGKTLGVIGGGNIGLHVVRIAKGFGMNVIVYDVKRNSFIKEILDFDYKELDELLMISDIITLHAPYNKYTHHLINGERIKRIKKGSLLINTARGGLVETAALITALDNGTLAGAGLDVLEGEEYFLEEGYICKDRHCHDAIKLMKQNNSLLHRENVVITPHNAFNSREAVDRIIETTTQNINGFIEGDQNNVINS